jgi:hypothetical protein
MAIHEFYRPATFTSWSLESGLAEGGSESSLSVSIAAGSPTLIETKGYVYIKQGDKREIVSYTAAPDANTLTIGDRGLSETAATGTALSETGVIANKKQFSPGASVEMATVHYYVGHLCDWGNGLRGSGSTELKIGLDTDVDIKLTAANGDANEPFLMYDASENAWVFSDDGVSTTKMVTGGGGLSAGDMINISASLINVDLDTNPGLESNASKLRVKIKAAGGITRDANGLSVDLANDFTWSGDHNFTGQFQLSGTQVTSTAAELNKLDGAGATVTAANLDTLTDTSDADALHTHGELALKEGINEATKAPTFLNFSYPWAPDADYWTVTNINQTVSNFFHNHAYLDGNSSSTGQAITTVGIGFNTNTTAGVGNAGLRWSDGKKVIVEFYMRLTTATPSQEMTWGLVTSTTGLITHDDDTDPACTFSIDTSNNLYFHTSDGANAGNKTTTQITGITLTANNLYRIEFDSGVDCKFYVNNTLEGTVSTTANLPQSNNVIKFGFGDYDNGVAYIVSRPQFSIEI